MQLSSAGLSTSGAAGSSVGKLLSRSRVHLAVDRNGALVEVHRPQERAVLELHLGVARGRLRFKLELDDGHRLLHARHQQRIAEAFALQEKRSAGSSP